MESNQKKVSECSPDDRFTIEGMEGVWTMSVPNVCGVSWIYNIYDKQPGQIPVDTIVTVIGVDVSNKELPILPEGYKYTLCQINGDKKEMSYEEACKWATEALEKEREEERKGFSDMIIFGQQKYHVSKDGIEHIPVDPAVGPDTPISVIPAWGEVEKEALSGIPEDLKNIKVETLPVYQSLEEILHDMIDQKRPLTIMSKLQDTINKGYYINTRPTE